MKLLQINPDLLDDLRRLQPDDPRELAVIRRLAAAIDRSRLNGGVLIIHPPTELMA